MRYRIHVVFEHGADLNPYGSAYIRLLRPLSHPMVADKIDLSSGTNYDGRPVDAVIVDRLWRPGVRLQDAESLVAAIRSGGGKLIYALDDNFLDFPADHLDRPIRQKSDLVRYWLREADAVWVTTFTLKERYQEYNENIRVIPHALDERLLVPPQRAPDLSSDFQRPVTVGYMGTFTHDEDLLMVAPALEKLSQRYGSRLRVELVGALGRLDTYDRLQNLPLRICRPRPEESNYPLFTLWFTSQVKWDIAIAPLRDSPFTRSKSDIKFLDYSAIGAASVFSRSPAYTGSVQSLENGILVDDDPSAWYESLERLILEKDLRVGLARNATEYLYAQRTLSVSANRWLEAIEALFAAD